MLINLGTDVHGKNLGWDTSTGTPLTHHRARRKRENHAA